MTVKIERAGITSVTITCCTHEGSHGAGYVKFNARERGFFVHSPVREVRVAVFPENPDELREFANALLQIADEQSDEKGGWK